MNTWRDRFKAFRRNVRAWFVEQFYHQLVRLPASSVPRLARLLMKLLRVIFSDQLHRAGELLPAEFSDRRGFILSGMAKNQVMNLLEVFFYEKLLEADPGFISVSGREHLDAGLSRGKGVLLLASHFCNWELIGYTLARLGYPIFAIARPQAVNRMTEFMNGFREKRGVKILMAHNLSASLRTLRKNGMIGVLADLNARERGYIAPFFGREASFYPTPILLSQRSGAPLIPVFDERGGDGRHHIRFESPVLYDPESPMPERIAAYVSRYEAGFRRRPDLWAWFHERYAHVELGRRS
ncbi:MAG TPA: lysophospholipid acyltransferase family protein [Candidatus Ozemobacteraceae bacterium]|nr:lysophospholipid acyltransferase family protein [Candidatus Ozemobacteraceae bacterium]